MPALIASNALCTPIWRHLYDNKKRFGFCTRAIIKYFSLQWRAFIKRGRLEKMDFEEIIDHLRVFLNPLLTAIRKKESFNKQWKAGGAWEDKSMIDQ